MTAKKVLENASKVDPSKPAVRSSRRHSITTSSSSAGDNISVASTAVNHNDTDQQLKNLMRNINGPIPKEETDELSLVERDVFSSLAAPKSTPRSARRNSVI